MNDQSSPPGHDRDYLTRREAQEREAAEHGPDPSARRAHFMLADGYAERLRAGKPKAG